MQLIPSISIINGQISRLKQGDYSKPTSYEAGPIDLCRKLEGVGVEVIHLVDLDGAREGWPVNYHILEAIVGHTNLRVDFTGGIHTDGDLSKAFEYGASYLTVGSVAVNKKSLFASWIISYGREKITLSADCLDKKVAVRGWQQATDIDIFDHIEYFYNRGLKYVKTTDISKDGTMAGPSIDLYKEIQSRFPDIKVLASGGVRNMDDIKALQDIGVFATIFGKAFFEGNISLEEIENFTAKA